MKKPRPPVFLEREGYRRRRLTDAARILPVLGVCLLMIPLMWPRPDPAAPPGAGAEAVPMSSAIVYVFAVWFGLVLLAALFGASVGRWGDADSARDPGRG